MSERFAISVDRISWTKVLDGAEMAVLSGDPKAAGLLYVIRLRTFKEVRVLPHSHPEDEHVTVLEGPFAAGLGEGFDETVLEHFPAGSYICFPRHVPHFTLYGAGTVIQVHGIGPLQTIYFDPK